METIATITGQEKIEFYFNNEILMEGPASEFFQEGSLHGKNIPLGIGDVFEVIDLKGEITAFRVMELQEGIYESGEIHTIKYFVVVDDNKK
ncbi:hypothetical protein P4679_33510 [Priestia megaterium]|uniref:hypothetical protein n=1 Tax=Priestia megaterium TaxID=1404 RepID=UPI002E20FA2C|nr:hypothetical protein [Priestia megaterium]